MGISFEAIWQGIINGVVIGWIYVLMALGLTLIFSIMRILQFAHGEIYMLGAYFCYFICIDLGINIYVTIAICMVLMAVMGFLIERFLFRPVREGHFLAPIAISVGMTLVLMSSAMEIFGLFWRSMPKLAVGSMDIIGGIVPKDRMVAVVASILLVIILYLFLKMTKSGQALVATAQDFEGAMVLGISRNKMSSLVMAIGCALAAAGGILAGSIFSINPTMGVVPMTKGIVIIVLGGVGSLLGATIAGIFLGLVDGLAIIFFGPAWASLIPLIIVILFILIRPQGLFGHES